MVPPRQSMTLKKTYVEAAKYLLFWIMVTVSREKVENVVNPPQKPACKKKTTLGLILFFLGKFRNKPDEMIQ
jgi:hypothetical protein